MNNQTIPGKTQQQRPVYFEKEAEKWGDFPLILKVKSGNYDALACSLTVFRNIACGHARILNYDFTLKSIFTLKCHFHSNGANFTYRSDKYPGDVNEQYARMLKLAKDNLKLTYSMQLYDNRRAAPDDLILNWKSGELIYQHQYLPIQTKLTDKDIDRVNIYSKAFFPRH